MSVLVLDFVLDTDLNDCEELIILLRVWDLHFKLFVSSIATLYGINQLSQLSVLLS